jgi:hypothetical protein
VGNAKRLALTFATIALVDLLLLGLLTLWQMTGDLLRGAAISLDPDLWLAALLLFLLLLPTGTLVDAVSIALPRATSGLSAYLVLPIGGGLIAGTIMLWLSHVETYFTPPGYEAAYFFVGAAVGGMYGIVRANMQCRFQPNV